MNLIKSLLVLAFSIPLAKLISIDMFSALVNVESLMITEKHLSKVIKLYYKKEKFERKNNQALKSLYRLYRKSRFKNINNAQEFVKNPINAFHLIKRLFVKWPVIKSAMKAKSIEDILENYEAKGKSLRFPEKVDLTGAAISLDRLHETYKIPIMKLANGTLFPGIKQAKVLTAQDCFDIGKELYENKLYKPSIKWLKAGLKVLKKEKTKSLTKDHFYQGLANNNIKLGRVNKSETFINKLLQLDPKNEKIQQIYNTYQEVFKKVKKNPSLITPIPSKFKEKTSKEVWKNYKLLCQNKAVPHPQMIKQLKCYYHTNRNPYLKIQPLKAEVAYKRPNIIIYYDVLNVVEIELIKKMATSNLDRATVVRTDGSLEPDDSRISKSAWLNDTTNPIILKISQRLEDISGLHMQASEELQVVNYGIGGYYTPHVDFISSQNIIDGLNRIGQGNRIATFLFYLSDVEAGGATVFPSLGANIPPKKGAAVFWYNLLRTGNGNYNTRHAACPVVYGNKWVANKWVHEYHQEFRRRCGKTKNDIY